MSSQTPRRSSLSLLPVQPARQPFPQSVPLHLLLGVPSNNKASARFSIFADQCEMLAEILGLQTNTGVIVQHSVLFWLIDMCSCAAPCPQKVQP